MKTNFTIVRGLAYYDGFIIETNLNFEVTNNKGKKVDIGSICSGGAYAKLISRFKGVDVPGTGISFGIDRLLFAKLIIVGIPTYAVAIFTEEIFYIVPTIAMTLMIANSVERGSLSNRNRIEEEDNAIDEGDGGDSLDGEVG